MLELICRGARLQLFVLQATAELGKQLRGLLVNLSRSMRNANSRMESTRHDHLILSAEQMSMSLQSLHGALRKCKRQACRLLFFIALSKMPGRPRHAIVPYLSTRGRIAAPSRTIRHHPICASLFEAVAPMYSYSDVHNRRLSKTLPMPHGGAHRRTFVCRLCQSLKRRAPLCRVS